MDSLDPFDTKFWPELDEIDCPCKGWGWAVIDGRDEMCMVHYHGQLHPQSKELLLDEPERLAEEEKKSFLNWEIKQTEIKISELKSQLLKEQSNLSKLQLELVNRTPTTKMKVVRLPQESSGK